MTNGKSYIPVWERYALTISEAAEYSNISEKTLRNRIAENGYDFILKVGTKTLIKRKKFEDFIDKVDAL